MRGCLCCDVVGSSARDYRHPLRLVLSNKHFLCSTRVFYILIPKTAGSLCSFFQVLQGLAVTFNELLTNLVRSRFNCDLNSAGFLSSHVLIKFTSGAGF